VGVWHVLYTFLSLRMMRCDGSAMAQPSQLPATKHVCKSKADELRLGDLERKILRRIYGRICEGAKWRSRYNEELYRLYDETGLVTTVRITRLRWAGHIVGKQDNLPCNENHLGQAGRQKASGKAKPQMDGWSDEGCREAVIAASLQLQFLSS